MTKREANIILSPQMEDLAMALFAIERFGNIACIPKNADKAPPLHRMMAYYLIDHDNRATLIRLLKEVPR